MIVQMQETIEKYKLIEPGDGILVALSGGPDSMALLHALSTLRQTQSIRLVALHVHHGIREGDADLDALAAETLCNRLEIPFEIRRVDVPSVAAAQGISLELAGRQVRYALLREVLNGCNLNKIAVAHHADDQCETFFMRLLRGSGSEGLACMLPIRTDGIIRPLLKVSKKMIEAYCRENQLGERIDSTNLESVYHRNRIRRDLIPKLQREYNPKLVESINHLTEQFAEDESYFKQLIQQKFSETATLVNQGGEFFTIKIDVAVLNELHPAVLSRYIRHLYDSLQGNLLDFNRSQVESVKDLLLSMAGTKRFSFKGIQFERCYGELIVTRLKKNTPIETVDENRTVPRVEAQWVDRNTYLENRHRHDVIYLDAENIQGLLYWRHRMSGDRFRPLGASGSKKLKDYLIDKKIPQRDRDGLWLLCDEQAILWVYGVKQSQYSVVDDNTSRILEIQMPNCCDTL